MKSIVVNLDPTWDFVQLCRTHGLDLFRERGDIRIWELSNLRRSDPRREAAASQFWSQWPAIVRSEGDVHSATVVDLIVEEIDRILRNPDDQDAAPVMLICSADALPPPPKPEASAAGEAASRLEDDPNRYRPPPPGGGFLEELRDRLAERNWRSSAPIILAVRNSAGVDEASLKHIIDAGRLTGVLLVDGPAHGARRRATDEEQAQFLRLRVALDWMTLDRGVDALRARSQQWFSTFSVALPAYTVDYSYDDALERDGDRTVFFRHALAEQLDSHWRRISERPGKDEFSPRVDEILSQIDGYGAAFVDTIGKKIDEIPSSGGEQKPSETITETAASHGLKRPWRLETRFPQIISITGRNALLELARISRGKLEEARAQRASESGKEGDHASDIERAIRDLSVSDSGPREQSEGALTRARGRVSHEMEEVREKIDAYWARMARSERGADGALIPPDWRPTIRFNDATAAATSASEQLAERGRRGFIFWTLLAVLVVGAAYPAYSFIMDARFSGGPDAGLAAGAATGLAVAALAVVGLAPFLIWSMLMIKRRSAELDRRFKGMDTALADLAGMLRGEMRESVTYSGNARRYALLRALNGRLAEIHAESVELWNYRTVVLRELKRGEPTLQAARETPPVEGLDRETYWAWIPHILHSLKAPEPSQIRLTFAGAHEPVEIDTRLFTAPISANLDLWEAPEAPENTPEHAPTGAPDGAPDSTGVGMFDFLSVESLLIAGFLFASLFFYFLRPRTAGLSGVAVALAALAIVCTASLAEQVHAAMVLVGSLAKTLAFFAWLAARLLNMANAFNVGLDAITPLIAFGAGVVLFIALCIGAVIIDSLMAAISGAMRSTRATRGASYSSELEAFGERFREVLRGPDIRAGLTAATFFLGALLAVYPIWRDALSPPFGDQVDLAFAAQAWLPFWLVILECTRLARSKPPKHAQDNAEDATIIDAQAMEAAQLWSAIIEAHEDLLIYASAPPVKDADAAKTSREPAEPPKLGGVADRILPVIERHGPVSDRSRTRLATAFNDYAAQAGSLLALPEPLTSAHLELVMELAKLMQDEGQFTLVVCPDNELDVLHGQFETMRGLSLASMNITIGLHVPLEAAERRPRAETVLEDDGGRQPTVLLIGESMTPDVIGRFIDPDGPLPIELLGQIVFLRMHRLELPVLRLQLARLALARNGATVRAICQSANWRNLEGAAQRLLDGLLSEDHRTRREEVLFDDQRRPFWAIWRDGVDVADRLRDHHGLGVGVDHGLPLSVAMAAPFADFGAEFFELDPLEKASKDALEEAKRVRAVAPDPELYQAAVELERVGSIFELKRRDAIGALRIVGHDLNDAMNDAYQAEPDGDIVVSLCAAEYPLRDYHISRLLHPGRRLRALSDIAPVFAPMPLGGLKELLAALLSALAQRGPGGELGLTRAEIETGFLDRLPSQLRRSLEITPTMAGLERLFDAVLTRGIRPAIQPTTGGGHEPPRLCLQTRFNHPDLIVSGQTGRGLAPADANLLHFPGQSVVINRDRAVVLEDGVKLRPDDSSSDPYLSVYYNELSYRLNVGADVAGRREDREPVVIDREQTFVREIGDVEYWRLSLCFERRPHGYFVRDPRDPVRPDDASAFNYRPHANRDLRVARSYQSAWHLAITPHAEIAAEDVPRVAFALAVVVQDVARALFSGRTHRLQIFSPQAAELQASAHGESAFTGLDRFVLRAYPKLELNPGEAFDRAQMMPWAHGAAHAGDENAGGRTTIDLVVLEDSDIDLGMVSAMHENFDAVRDEIQKYLAWLEAEDWRNPYFGFGSDVLPSVLDFQAAAKAIPPKRHNAPAFAPRGTGPIWSGAAATGNGQ